MISNIQVRTTPNSITFSKLPVMPQAFDFIDDLMFLEVGLQNFVCTVEKTEYFYETADGDLTPLTSSGDDLRQKTNCIKVTFPKVVPRSFKKQYIDCFVNVIEKRKIRC